MTLVADGAVVAVCIFHPLCVAEIDSRDVHVVRVRVNFASQYITYNKTFETTADCLNLFDALGLKTNGCKGC